MHSDARARARPAAFRCLPFAGAGAGKTYTMFGEGHAGGDERLPHKRGIVPRVCEEVVRAMDARRACGIDAELSVAYVEVFGAQVAWPPCWRAPRVRSAFGARSIRR